MLNEKIIYTNKGKWSLKSFTGHQLDKRTAINTMENFNDHRHIQNILRKNVHLFIK